MYRIKYTEDGVNKEVTCAVNELGVYMKSLHEHGVTEFNVCAVGVGAEKCEHSNVFRG